MSKATKIALEKPTNQNPYEDRAGLIYARVSSKKQELDGHGRESQEGRCKSDLTSISVPFEKSFLDTYTGGGDFMNRPAMREMLGYIDANPHKKFVVVFDDLKRFARDTVFHLKLRATLQARDVSPRCLNFNFDDSPEGMFVETVLAAGNELERHQNRRQVIQKMKARLEAGYWPFAVKRGYDMVKDTVHGKLCVPNSEGLGVLKDALESFATGNLARKIDFCKYLVERGFWKNQPPEKYITKATLILEDCFHCGDIAYPVWGVTRRKGQHEGIITRNTHELILKRLKKNGATTRIRKTISDDFPLRGLILCPSCMHPFTAAWTKGAHNKFPYYYCQHKGCTLYGKMLRKADVEGDFKDIVIRNKLKEQVEPVASLVFDRVWQQEVAYLKMQQGYAVERQAELRKKVHELSELARKTKSDVVRRAYEKEIEDAEREAEGLEKQKARLDLSIPYRTAYDKATGMLKSPITVWESVNVYEKHRLFFFLFEEKLPYSKTDAYWTADSLSTTRLFEQVAVANAPDVEVGRIELPSKKKLM